MLLTLIIFLTEAAGAESGSAEPAPAPPAGGAAAPAPAAGPSPAGGAPPPAGASPPGNPILNAVVSNFCFNLFTDETYIVS